MTKEVIVTHPSDKLLKLVDLMRAKKNSDQQKLSELKECTFTIDME